MTNQLALDFARTHSRRGGPESSNEAARKHKESGANTEQKAVILAAVKAHPGRTANELEQFCDGLVGHKIMKRLPEMKGEAKAGDAYSGTVDCIDRGKDPAIYFAREG